MAMTTESTDLPMNYIVKQQLYRDFKFPENTGSTIIVKCSPSGIGFRSKYYPEYEGIIDKDDFEAKLSEVGGS